MSDCLLLVRHGLTDWNREGRFQGHLDPPLSDDGREQARLIATRLAASAKEPARRIVSSPLLRALETAEIIAEALGLPTDKVVRDARLRELGQGAWEGRTHAELAVSDADDGARTIGGPATLQRVEQAGDCRPGDDEPLAQGAGRRGPASRASPRSGSWTRRSLRPTESSWVEF